MAITDKTIPSDVVLNCDLYELTMAQGYWQTGRANDYSCFNIFFRDNPFKGGYAVACGVGQIPDLVQNFTFSEETLAYLKSLTASDGSALFHADFLAYLKDFKLNIDVYSVREGEIVFPRQPFVRVEGRVIDCQLIETALLNLVNFQTLVATKSARVCFAAKGRQVCDFGLRRAQGFDGALSVARAAYVGGVAGTSNCLAGKVYGMPVFGTHAHSWVMSFGSELEAFRAFAQSSPKNCTLLVDTYGVEQGVKNAITVAHEMEAQGERLRGIRIDSGDLSALSQYARKHFDAHGLDYVSISVSNDLDEYTIQSLLAQGAPIDSFGVGTKLATCDSQPSLGGVYKLCAIKKHKEDEWQPVMKLSEHLYKRTIPGVQNVRRYYSATGVPLGDIIFDEAYQVGTGSTCVDVLDSDVLYEQAGAYSKNLLSQIIAEGKPVHDLPTLSDSREYATNQLKKLDNAVKRFLNPQKYPVGIEFGLAQLRTRLTREKGILH